MSDENVELDRQNRDLEVLREVYSRWERGDFTYSEVFAEDFVWKAVDAIESGELAGFGEVTPAWRTWLQAWGGFSIKAEEMVAGSDGRYVVMQLFRGKGKASGLESEERSACVVTMRHGLIARMEGCCRRPGSSADEALQAAGLVRRSGTTAMDDQDRRAAPPSNCSFTRQGGAARWSPPRLQLFNPEELIAPIGPRRLA
jgi:ketosteroid isomerase-like protein